MMIRQILAAGTILGMQAGGVAYAQEEAPDQAAVQDIIVTGSRVVTNGNASPTPLTIVTAQALLKQTPSNLPDALNKLPQFAQTNAGQARNGSGGGVQTANTLDLRNFGAQRNLILFNGLRVPSTTSGGGVDLNVLPQMLISRVDVVTGGVSAVYGSDAVTGVVNFVVDNKFNGIKMNAQGGISSRGDNKSWKVGAAAGAALGERGHIVFSYEHFDSNGIPSHLDRKGSRTIPTVTGAGSAANPFVLTQNGRASIYTNGGLIVVGPAGLLGQDFTSNGVLTPFANGLPTGSAGLQSGGGGLYFGEAQLFVPLVTDQAYGRIDYELTDDLTAYVDLGLSQSRSRNGFLPFGTNGLAGGGGRSGALILSGNAFLPASVQSTLTASGAPSFVLSKYESGDSPIEGNGNRNRTRNILATTGLEGKVFGGMNWNAAVRYGRTNQRVINPGSINASRFAAAIDAVVNPANGQIVCQVSLTANASLFPGCVPINLFGPTATSVAAADYVTDDTRQNLINEQTSFTFGLSGDIFSTWAGPVRASVSGEYRDVRATGLSTANPLDRADCTGLRANCAQGITPAYFGYTSGPFKAKQNIKEIAMELLVPLVADVPFIRKFEVNGAARYTDYSTSGSVETWKVGANWEISDELRFRATRSRDIRAPSLYELFRAPSASLFGFTDLHTGVTRTVTSQAQGNPNLVPEVARTLTIGAVYKPGWFPRFSLSVDYYNIKLKKAITAIAGTSVAIQRLCEDSNGLSPFCSLYIRPGPFSDRSPANTATTVLTQSLNVARQTTKGIDIEANYNFDLGKGRVDLRLLAAHQPKLLVQQLPGGTIINNAGVNGLSKTRVNFTLAYSDDDWGLTINQRWQSKQKAYAAPIVSQVPSASAYAYTDVTLEYKLPSVGNGTSLFVNVQNLFDKDPPIFGGTAGAPGLINPYGFGYDIVGRYFTAGVRTTF